LLKENYSHGKLRGVERFVEIPLNNSSSFVYEQQQIIPSTPAG
jgi:hypothetical protein